MKLRQALATAVKSIRFELRRVAFDGSLQEKFKADLPGTIAALKKKNELQETIKFLEAYNVKNSR